MCLAMALKKGTKKYEDLIYNAIKNSSETNTDGIGYAFKRASTKKVYISKGYKNVDAVWEQLLTHKLKEDDELIIHLRNGNKGTTNVAMCHPFVCHTDKEEVMSNDQYVHNMVMIHNGTFQNYSDYNSYYSDTFNIATEFFSIPEIQTLMKRDLALFESSFRRVLGSNKLVFLFPDEATPLITIGKFIEKDGYLFSNESYKDKTVVDYGGSNYLPAHRRYNGFRNQAYYDGFGYDDEYDEYDDISTIGESNSFEKNLTVVGDEEDDLPFATDNVAGRSELVSRAHHYSGAVSTDILFPTSVAKQDEFLCGGSGVKYRRLGNAYIPEQYSGDQFQSIRVRVNEFNYGDFEFVSQVVDTARDIEKFCYYVMDDYETGGDMLDTEAPSLHRLKRKYSKVDQTYDTYVYVTTEYILKNFRVSYIIENQRKYKDYFYLLSRLPLTKVTLVHMQKFINKDSHKLNDTVKFRGHMVKKCAVLVFYYDLLKQIFPTEYRTKLALLN